MIAAVLVKGETGIRRNGFVHLLGSSIISALFFFLFPSLSSNAMDEKTKRVREEGVSELRDRLVTVLSVF